MEKSYQHETNPAPLTREQVQQSMEAFADYLFYNKLDNALGSYSMGVQEEDSVFYIRINIERGKGVGAIHLLASEYLPSNIPVEINIMGRAESQ